MPYTMEIWCDGACRGNGTPRAVGGWGVHIQRRWGKCKQYYGALTIPRQMNLNANDTNNRGSRRADECCTGAPTDHALQAERHAWAGLLGAELTAVIQSLILAIEVQNDLRNPGTRFICTIHSDSKLTVDSMDQWVYKWRANGWLTSKGTAVKNVDLIKRALSLIERIEENNGRVDWEWISRADNEDADELANRGCDLAEEHRSKGYYAAVF